MDYESADARLMRLSDAELLRVLANEDAAARAARATAAPAPRSFVGVAQNRNASSVEAQRWLEAAVTKFGRNWKQAA